jgi:hypothetical protein
VGVQAPLHAPLTPAKAGVQHACGSMREDICRHQSVSEHSLRALPGADWMPAFAGLSGMWGVVIHSP